MTDNRLPWENAAIRAIMEALVNGGPEGGPRKSVLSATEIRRAMSSEWELSTRWELSTSQIQRLLAMMALDGTIRRVRGKWSLA